MKRWLVVVVASLIVFAGVVTAENAPFGVSLEFQKGEVRYAQAIHFQLVLHPTDIEKVYNNKVYTEVYLLEAVGVEIVGINGVPIQNGSLVYKGIPGRVTRNGDMFVAESVVLDFMGRLKSPNPVVTFFVMYTDLTTNETHYMTVRKNPFYPLHAGVSKKDVVNVEFYKRTLPEEVFFEYGVLGFSLLVNVLLVRKAFKRGSKEKV